MNNGIKNEEKIVISYDGKKVKALSMFQKQVIKRLFGNVNDNDVVYSGLCHRISKGDVYLQINNEIKYLSIKSGNTDSMHFESIVSFILFFRKLGVSEKTQKILLLFHYGDGTLDGTGSRRMLFEELYIKYKYLIEFASKELNSKEIVSKCLDRFVIKGTENSKVPVDYFYYGDDNYGVLCSSQDLKRFVLSRNYDHYKTLHVGPMSFQPYLRDVNGISRHQYKRNIVQVKWHYFLTDLQKTLQFNNKQNKYYKYKKYDNY